MQDNIFSRIDEAMRQEDEKIEQFSKMVKDNLDVFVVLWKFGDGNGGWIFEEIKNAVEPYIEKYEKRPLKSYEKKKKIPPNLRKQVYERDMYRCVYCGTHVDLSIDHIFPESKGGELVLENLQTLCLPCNKKKGNR